MTIDEREAMAIDERSLFIGHGLQKIRSIKNVTQSVLSDRSGLSINFLSRVENGKKGVSQSVVERLAEALSIPASFLYLLGDRSDSPLVKDLQDAVLRSLSKSTPKISVVQDEERKRKEPIMN